MKLLSAAQIRELDSFTIAHEPISSIQLMERAATACTAFLLNHFNGASFTIFAGTGNNGGDGLAIARLLSISGLNVEVVLVGNFHNGSADFKTNLERLKLRPQIKVHVYRKSDEFKPATGSVIVDSLFGTGLNRNVSGDFTEVIKLINGSGRKVVSIDVPSGLPSDPDESMLSGEIVYASHTLCFHIPKISFLFEQFAAYVGELHILDIGLNKEFHKNLNSDSHILFASDLAELLIARSGFSYKNTFGHGLLIAGSKGKMGAAILSAKAFLKAGAGLLTAHIPSCGYNAFQTAIPEAMCEPDANEDYISALNHSNYDAVICGPGLGLNKALPDLIHQILSSGKSPILLDADALNVLSENPELWKHIKNRDCLLTPHPGEFERLFNCGKNPVDQYAELRKQAVEKACVIVLKGAYTRIATPDGQVYFNSSGNAGMATAGSGDVLSGIIGALMCSGYTAKNAALLGVYIHGLAGDIYASNESQESLIASEIINCLGQAWRKLHEISLHP